MKHKHLQPTGPTVHMPVTTASIRWEGRSGCSTPVAAPNYIMSSTTNHVLHCGKGSQRKHKYSPKTCYSHNNPFCTISQNYTLTQLNQLHTQCPIQTIHNPHYVSTTNPAAYTTLPTVKYLNVSHHRYSTLWSHELQATDNRAATDRYHN